jgi:GTP-binding protein Era
MVETAAEPTRCGYVAILGAPNVGKSTLLNRLVGSKVSIVSPKVQTTRTRILGIAIEGAAQIVYLDTPGIFFTPRRRFERAMVAAAWQGAADADLVLLLVDASRRKLDEDTQRILAGLEKSRRKAILVLNKIDLVKREALLALSQTLHGTGLFTDVFMVSAETGDGVADLPKALAPKLPAGPWLFPEDQLTDMPQRLLAAEVTREQLFRQLHQEVPYSLIVESEAWEEFKDGSVKIDQTIFVERESQKAIVVGKAGARIKAVREAAQRELEAMLERRVHLFLQVKVRENWAEDRGRFRDLGLDYDV